MAEAVRSRPKAKKKVKKQTNTLTDIDEILKPSSSKSSEQKQDNTQPSTDRDKLLAEKNGDKLLGETSAASSSNTIQITDDVTTKENKVEDVDIAAKSNEDCNKELSIKNDNCNTKIEDSVVEREDIETLDSNKEQVIINENKTINANEVSSDNIENCNITNCEPNKSIEKPVENTSVDTSETIESSTTHIDNEDASITNVIEGTTKTSDCRLEEVQHEKSVVQDEVNEQICELNISEKVKTEGEKVDHVPENVATAPPMSLPSLEGQQNIASLQSLVRTAECTMEPFTEDQLSVFYFNQELLQLEIFIDDFIRNSDQEGHEFYEMVETYQKSRKKLVDVEVKIKTLQDQCSSHQKKIWVFEKTFVKGKGMCACGNQVEQMHQYQQGEYDKKISDKLSDDLSLLRGHTNETIQLEYYNSHHLKIKIDDYLARIYRSSRISRNKIRSDLPVSALLPRDISPDHIPFLCIIRECISILFSFKRINNLEPVFQQHLDEWLNLLVATLQKLGTLPDCFFILNHLLRCPPDTVADMAHFIQFPQFITQTDFLQIFDRPQIHHFVVMLATSTLPVKSRKEFLMKFHREAKDLARGISWTLVDESKDEVEYVEDGWSFLTENDLMALLEQFPFYGLLRAVLSFKEGDHPYSPANTLSHDMMRTFALFTCIINLLGRIFDTYNMLRYRRVLRTASCNIRLIVQVISDHWLAYKDYRSFVVGDNFSDIPVENSQPQFSLQRLQIEFDEFFKRAVSLILHSQNSGAIQFLSIMPFKALSSNSLWMLLDLLLKRNQSVGYDAVATINVSPSEGIFLLTTLSNMATSRDSSDHEFVDTVVRCVIDISFLNESLSELYIKNGQDMLIAITAIHPSAISAMIHHVKNNLDALRKHLLNIFEDLSFVHWKPTIKDIDCLRSFLLEAPLNSAENNLSRNILSHLNFHKDKESESLFLPLEFHYLCAILVVEAYGLTFPDFPGGIQKLDYDALGLLGQVSKFAVSSYSRLVYNQLHADFISWAWNILLQLKLHQSDIIGTNINPDNYMLSTGSSDTWTAKTLKSFKGKQSFDLDVNMTSELLNVRIAMENKGLLASYVAFAMTKHGHYGDQFLNKGMSHLKLLSTNSCHNAVLRIISALTSLFIQCPEKLQTESFSQVLLTTVHIDVDSAGYTEKLWQYFVTGVYSHKLSALISSQVQCNNQIQALKIIHYWLTILIKLPYWARDYSVLYQIDNLCKVSFTVSGGVKVIVDILYDEFKSLIHAQEKKGLLSSMMSWLSTSQIISFMPKLTGDFCYLGFAVMTVEVRFEKEISLWKEFTAELLNGNHMTLEQAYKKMLSGIKSFYVPPLYELSIYRWGMLAMAAPYDHPFTPILWQNFFLVFLQRHDMGSGTVNQRGVGLTFFGSMSTLNTSRKMKSHLQALASYHQEKSTSPDITDTHEWKLDEKKHFYSKEFHEKLSKMYQCFVLWIDESRLHDQNLYLSTLPDVYRGDLLEKIFQGNLDMWVEFIDYDRVMKEVEVLSKVWMDLYHSTSTKECQQPKKNETEAHSRIIRRLKREEDTKSPPQLVIPRTSIQEINFDTLLIRPKLLQDVNNALEHMLKYAKDAASFSASHVALDLEFCELLKDCYENINRRMVLGIPCDGRQRRRHAEACKAPARVTIEFKELLVKERILRMVTENREYHKQMIASCTKFITDDLCYNAVVINNIITKFEHTFQHPNTSQRADIQSNATYLFYLLAQLIDDDIKRCYPAIQFFSTSVEKLGKTFIANNSSEQLPLIEAISRQESSIIYVAPFFTPMSASDRFVQLYAKVVSLLKVVKPTSVFVLLSKFDINVWLERKPSLSDKIDVIACALDALRQLGFQPNSEGLVLLEIYRSHMLAILMTNRADLFGKVLLQFLLSSSEKSLSPLCWDDFLSAIEYDVDNEIDPIPYVVIKDTLEYMGSFYLHNIDQLGSQLDIFYEIWEPYCKAVNKLLFRLYYTFVKHNMNLMNDNNRDHILREMWEIILTPYRPWLLPKMPGKIWTLLRNESVSYMVQSMTEVIRMFIEMMSRKEQKYSDVMNYLWSFYFDSVVTSVTENQSLEIFNNAFLTLPWSAFCPTIDELDNVLQCHENYPYAFRFFGSVLPEIEWISVLSSYTSSGDALSISQLHQRLFRIFTLVATNKEILKISAPKLIYLFSQAKTFRWESIRLEETSLSCKWYAENIDPVLILDKDSIVWVALDLFKNVCGFTDLESMSNGASLKRNLYVQLIVTILIRCSNDKKTAENITFVLEDLLKTIERSISFNTQSPLEELTLHSSTFLNLLNMISNSVVVNVVKVTMETHMFNTQCNFLTEAFLSAALRSMANIQQMVWLLECCIKCHFMRLSDQELPNSWMAIYTSFSPPELEKDTFVKEAIKQKAVLTLYSYNLYRIPRTDANGQIAILNEITQWCTKISPDGETESKLVLLWLQLFDLIRSLVSKTTSGNHLNQISRDMIYLSHACQICGEDKIYNGVLGAIGIGRKSALSKEFRLSSKALHLFILAQMPSSGNVLRTSSDSPGSLCRKSDDRIRPTPDAEKAFSNFQNLLRNKNYNTMTESIKWVLEFVSKPEVNLVDGCSLIVFFCTSFFCKENYIAAAIRR